MLTINSPPDILVRLQKWYASMCNDDWEHTYGIFISNIDNPGWSVKIELKDTYLFETEFLPLELQRKDSDNWINCVVENGEFQGYGGPENLNELLDVFLAWAEKNAPQNQ